MRKLVAEIFDPRTRYEYELPLPSDLVRALEFDAKFNELHLGLVEVAAARSEKRAVGCRVPADNFYGLKHFAAAGRARFEVAHRREHIWVIGSVLRRECRN